MQDHKSTVWGSRGSQPAESETTDASRFRLRLRLRLREKREIMTNGVDEEMLHACHMIVITFQV